MHDELYKKYTSLQLIYYQEESNNKRLLQKAKNLDEIIVALLEHQDTNKQEKDMLLAHRAALLASIINDEECLDKKAWLFILEDLIKNEYEKNCQSFEHEDTRLRLLSMRKFMRVAKSITLLNKQIVKNNYAMRKYEKLYFDIKGNCKL